MVSSVSDLVFLVTTAVAPATAPPFTVLALAGDLDVVTTPRLRDTLDALSRVNPRIVLDLQAVAACDQSGLQVLASGHERCRARGGWLALACVPPDLSRILDFADLTEQLPMYPTLASALRVQPYYR